MEVAVHHALAAQNAVLPPSPARDAHLRALRDGALAVVTGQQVGLFLGPLYTLYKAASAIRLARALSEESGEPVVPVFWLQTEDHDLPEIASVQALDRDGMPVTLRLPADREDPRIPIAHRTLPQEMGAALGTLRRALQGLPHAERHLELLARHYRSGAGWSSAFAGVLGELFAPEGLVLLDPRDGAMVTVAARVHRRALEDAEGISAALAERAARLEAEGRPVQVHVRRDSPLSFFHPDGPAGPRVRLDRCGDGRFAEHTGARTWSRSELLATLESEPLRFSTSALLRPILQDTLLNTAAYVGGPAEVAYFAQLPPLYEAFGMTMPRVLQRSRFRLVDREARSLLEALGLSAASLPVKLAEDALLGGANAGTTASLSADALEQKLVEAFERALTEAGPALAQAGSALETPLRKTRSSVRRYVGKLAKHYGRAVLHADGERVAQARRLLARLQPEGAPQERIFGLSSFSAQVGDRALVERVLAAVELTRTGTDGLLAPVTAQKDLLL